MREVARRRGGIAAGFWFAFGLAACGNSTGNKPGPTEPGAAGEEGAGGSVTDGSGGKGAAGAAGSMGGSAGTAGNGLAGATEAGAPPEGGHGPVGELSPVPSELRRLTATEYTATVEDLLGTTLQPQLAEFATQVDGFDNNAAQNGVSESLYLRYLETAEQLAAEVFASSALRAQVVGCELPDDVPCVRQIAAALGLRLFRQPLLDEDLDAYQDAYERARDRDETHHGAVEEMLIALLASAQFVYRMEYVPTEIGAQPISPYELATRLSYLLWSSAPDDALLQAAAQDELGTDAALQQSVERLLADPRAARFTESFAGQWLGARRLPSVAFDPVEYPQWNAGVAGAAAAEIYAHFARLLSEDRDFRELLQSHAHFVDASLAPLYGLPSPGATATWVELSGVDRQGFLGLVGFLALGSSEVRTVPSRRGRFILQQLLCAPVGEPPIDMPLYAGTEQDLKGHLEDVSAQATCAFCHAKLDPLGLALENYDALGRFRTVYQNAAIIDPSGTVQVAPLLPAGLAVSGVASLSEALAEAPAFTACTAQKLYTYGMGRAYAESEIDNVEALAGKWQAGSLTLRELILGLVLSPTFRLRSDGGAL